MGGLPVRQGNTETPADSTAQAVRQDLSATTWRDLCRIEMKVVSALHAIPRRFAPCIPHPKHLQSLFVAGVRLRGSTERVPPSSTFQRLVLLPTSRDRTPGGPRAKVKRRPT